MGPAIRAKLEVHFSRADREMQTRLREIIGLFDLRIPNDLPTEIVGLLLRFNEQDHDLQVQVISCLNSLGHHRLIYDLGQRSTNRPEFISLLEDEFSYWDVLRSKIESEDWPGVAEIIEHPFNRDQQPEALVYWWAANHRLQDERNALASAVQDGEFTDLDIGLLITASLQVGELNEALQWVPRIKNPALRTRLDRSLRIQSGDWGWVLQQTEMDRPVTDLSTELLGQRLVSASLAGDTDTAKDALAEIQNRIHAIPIETNSAGMTGDMELLIRAILAAGELDIALQIMKDRKAREGVGLAVYYQNYSVAESILGMNDDASSRMGSWLDRQLRALKSADGEYERTGDSAAQAKTTRVFDNLILVAEMLDAQGLDRQASFFLQRLGQSIGNNSYDVEDRLTTIAEKFFDLRDAEGLSDFLATRFGDETDFWRLCERIFPEKSEAGLFWFYRLRNTTPDFFERLQLTAQLLNAQLPGYQAPTPFDFERWLQAQGDELRDGFGGENEFAGIWEYNVALCWLYRGQIDKFNEYLDQAAKLGYSQARVWQGRESFEAKDFVNSARVNSALITANELSRGDLVLTSIRADQASAAINDHAGSARAKIVAYIETIESPLQSNDYRDAVALGLGGGLADILQSALAAECFDEASGSYGSDLYFRNVMASYLEESDPRRAISQLNAMLMDVISAESTGSLVFVANLNQRLKMMQIELLIDNGQVDAAEQMISAAIRVRPADASIAEKLISRLQARGYNEAAGRLIRQFQAGFLEKLAKYPASPLLLNNFAWANACCRVDLEFSIRLAERATAQRPDYGSYIDTLAELHFLRGDRSKAIELSQQCLRIHPDRPHYRSQYRKFLNEGAQQSPPRQQQ